MAKNLFISKTILPIFPDLTVEMNLIRDLDEIKSLDNFHALMVNLEEWDKIPGNYLADKNDLLKVQNLSSIPLFMVEIKFSSKDEKKLVTRILTNLDLLEFFSSMDDMADKINFLEMVELKRASPKIPHLDCWN
jgi:hypothetical protein